MNIELFEIMNLAVFLQDWLVIYDEYRTSDDIMLRAKYTTAEKILDKLKSQI